MYHFRSMKPFVLVFILFIFLNPLFSQHDVTSALVKQQEGIKEAPNVASLSKFTKWPINYSTGLVNIELPIYNISVGSIQVPISLRYHSGGVKVNDPSGWTGIGWSLIAGGNLSRQINGLDDFLNNTSFAGSYVNPDFSPLNVGVNSVSGVVENILNNTGGYSSEPDYMNKFGGRIIQGCIDGEADDFYLSAPGLSGKINFNQKTQVFQMDDINGYTVEPDFANGSYNSLPTTWIVKSNSGIEYHFGLVEYVENPIYYQVLTEYQGRYCQEAVPPMQIAKSWHLSSIKDTRVNKEVNFYYSSEYIISRNGIDIVRDYRTDGQLASHSENENIRKGNEHYLTYIDFGEGKIYFDKAGGIGFDGGINSLEAIRIVSKDGSLIKQFSFEYENITSDVQNFSTNNQYKNASGITSLIGQFSTRRYLKAISETNTINNTQGKVYEITYKDRQLLPARFSFSQDHWGYNNGASNPSLLPFYELNAINSYDKFIMGANREPNESFSSAGIIESITYQTKGKTKFYFESNKIDDGYSYKLLGGLRIKSVDYIDNITGQVSTNNFSYNNVLAFDNFKYSYHYVSMSFNFAEERNKVFGSSINPMNRFSGSPVLYGTVQEDISGEGSEKLRTIYSYSNSFADEYPANYDYGKGVPFNKAVNFSNYSGLLSKVQQFKNENGQFLPVKRIEKDYLAINGLENFFWNVQGAWAFLGDWMVDMEHDPFTRNPLTYYASVNCYKTLKEKVAIKYEREFSYTNTGLEVLVSEKEFEYKTDDGLVKRVYIKDSKGNTICTEFNYASEFSGFQGISMYKSDLMEVVKKIKLKGESDYKVLGGEINYYSEGKVIKNYKLNIRTHLLEGNYTKLQGTNGQMNFDSRYKEDVDYSDFNQVNLPGTIKSNSNLIAYLWDPESLELSAKFIDADFNNVAFSSFERPYKGNWEYDPNNITFGSNDFGNNSYKLNSNITKNGLNAGLNYFLRYWVLGAQTNLNLSNCVVLPGYPRILSTLGNWSLVEYKVSQAVGIVINASGQTIDELLLFPENSNVNTFNYKPLVGIISNTDQLGKRLFYDYDSFGRLESVKDSKGNIVKYHCYNYSGQPIQCGVRKYKNSLAYSGQFVRNNCISPGFTGSTVTYTIPENSVISYVSVEHANSLAQQRMNYEGPFYANIHGICEPTPIIYAKLWYENIDSSSGDAYADIIVRFYSDVNCTNPVEVSNISVLYKKEVDSQWCLGFDDGIANANDVSEILLESSALIDNRFSNPYNSCFFIYGLRPSSEYVIVQ